MTEFDNQINKIKNKIEALKKHNQQITSENEELINHLLILREQLDKAEKRVDELENKNLNLQYSSSLKGDEKDKFKTIINELLTEIDKGLGLLKG